MAEEFTPITSQEQFDNAIKERIGRLNEKHSKEMSEALAKYSDYEELKNASKNVSEYEKQIKELTERGDIFESKIKELTTENEGYKLKAMKQAIALDAGIPFEMAERLNGANEEELKADAEKLKPLFAAKQSAPLAEPSATNTDSGVMAAFRKMNPNIKL